MKNIRIAAGGLAVTTVAAVVGLSTAASGATAPCTPKTVTVKGHPGLEFCGPAIATLTIGGKTYTFRNGHCAEASPNSDFLQLSLAFDVPALAGPNNNGGKPGFSLDIAKHHTSATIGFAFVGGRELVRAAPVTLKGGPLPAQGTFKGQRSAFSGSWNCRGVITKS